MKDILLDQVRRGATVFLTSHVLDVVERLCDQIAILKAGEIVLHGSIEEIRHTAAQENATLEEIFLRAVGGTRPAATLSWL